jgi:hypothetical protein
VAAEEEEEEAEAVRAVGTSPARSSRGGRKSPAEKYDRD